MTNPEKVRGSPLYIFVIIFVSIVIGYFLFFQSDLQNNNTFTIELEIADTLEKRIKGLSGREGLDQNAGLLFVYDQPGIYGIWMKDMKFPIDVIWLDEDYRVVDIVKNAAPDSFPRIFEPSKPALYILEVNAGFAERNNIGIGDSLNLF